MDQIFAKKSLKTSSGKKTNEKFKRLGTLDLKDIEEEADADAMSGHS